MEVDYIECGDCFELIKNIPDKSIDVIFTSPPYNSKRFDKYDDFNDKYIDYFKFLSEITEQALRVTKKYFILNVQTNYYNKKDVYKFIGEYSSQIQRIVIWEKTNPTPSSLPHRLTNSYELFIIFGESVKINSVFQKDIIQTSINTIKINGHKAVMNKDICNFFIKEFTQENDIVLDPFLGSGTTAICCVELNRHYIGFEISEEYFDTACKRLDEVEVVS